MKQILLPILGTIAFIIVVGFLTKGSFLVNKTTTTTNTEKQIKIGTTVVKVEVADTDQKRSLGLGNKNSLEADRGMLFIFPQKATMRNFWMKDMSFAIDIIWIKDGKIVKIDKNVLPEPGVTDSQLKVYSPNQPIDYVLEVNAGFADKNSIAIGQTLSGL